MALSLAFTQRLQPLRHWLFSTLAKKNVRNILAVNVFAWLLSARKPSYIRSAIECIGLPLDCQWIVLVN